MKLRQYIVSLIIFLIAAFILLLANISAASAPGDTHNLHLIKRVYISQEKKYGLTDIGIIKEKRLIAYLNQELQNIGFVVVDDPSSADAILQGDFGWMAVFDGPQPDPPQYFYEYQLSTIKKDRLWHNRFTITSRSSEVEVDSEAAQKIATKLLSAWLASAEKAGMNVRDRIQ
jgi:hypothetical protein